MKKRNKIKYQAPIPKPKGRERGQLGGGKIYVRSGK